MVSVPAPEVELLTVTGFIAADVKGVFPLLSHTLAREALAGVLCRLMTEVEPETFVIARARICVNVGVIELLNVFIVRWAHRVDV